MWQEVLEYLGKGPLMDGASEDWVERLGESAIQEACQALWGLPYMALKDPQVPQGMTLVEALDEEAVISLLDGQRYLVQSPEHRRSDTEGVADGLAIRSALLGRFLPRGEGPSLSTQRQLTAKPCLQYGDLDGVLSILLEDALVQQATDIHLIPGEVWRVTYRQCGRLKDRWRLPGALYSTLLNRLKILGAMDIAENILPQDGHFLFQRSAGDVAVRLASMGTVHGEKIVLRLLPQERCYRTLETLGLSSEQIRQLRMLVRMDRGLMVLSGPTNSGKTTLLYALLEELAAERHIYSMEDPIEAPLQGVEQIECHPARGLDYQEGLRGLLRLDPEVLMIGELRDGESAHMAVRAALTGALVITTLHCGDAQEVVSRMNDLGVSRELLATTLLAAGHQRLMPSRQGKLTLLQELWQPDREERESIRRGEGPLALRRKAKEKGFIPLGNDARKKAAEGMIDAQAGLRLLGKERWDEDL